ncbi:hypothetical protein GT037_006673 [Alternaria burnsii]|uniref:BAH domain-containing protein n=1 Tax=Alternaria burnsii TaxID=1187904 RepID=A0A8H7B4N1_9PLEO|nr:uncharacterized protein GT037_006673 [Alternaria burnsii]KAF7674910.1 hypothetical protein GT037_006673 [Alternaria burnsii]
MVRKRKVVDEKSAHTGSTPSASDATNPSTKKRKIDWSTVDSFPGFKVIGVDTKARKKPGQASTTQEKRNADNWEHHKYPGHLMPLDADIVQPNPFQGAPLGDLHVKISPARYWESTNRYRKFTINGEEFQVGQMVFVRKSEEDHVEEGPNSIQHWLAKVLEVRAGDASHVYLRVFWAYRPEDLPGGRQPYHGRAELIISNHMDIIEAVTVESSAEVVHWNDDLDSMALLADQLFFRQSYDITKKTNRLSKLNTYCIDKQPSNPDELLVQCPHCSEWLHAGCLKERALQDLSAKQVASPPKPKKRGRPSKGELASSQSEATHTFEAKIKGGSKTRLTIMEKHEGKTKRKWNVDISCLMCGEMIEKAEEDVSEKAEEDASEKPVTSTPAAQASDDADVQDITTPTKASGVGKTPTRDGDSDSVIGDADDDQEVEVRDAPTADTESKGPRKRGRPLGSLGKKRKRASYISTKKATSLHTQRLKTETGKEGSPDAVQDMDTSAVVVATITATTASESAEDATVTTKSEPTEEVPTVATLKTPAPASISESVFQSGVRSMKRLLWPAR